jgi:serine/threonine-protein kinase
MNATRPHTGPMIAGSVLGSYRILDELSRGGMGAVFRAEHVLLGRPAAVKLLRSELTTDADLVQRFVNEARAVTACKHPGIVEVYDFGYTPDGHAYFVMELLEGESLGRRLARVRLCEPEAAAIAHGIASALRAAHRVGVIHRDLKPDNVFLVPDPDGGFDRTKVLDFGIAKLGDSAATPTRRTRSGILMGTPLYMAPEQARAAGMIDIRADLYSLGCIIYHMLVGRPPFVADGAGEIIALQMFGQVEPPSRLAAVTPEMERLVLRLLEKDPAARFDSAADVVGALALFDHAMTNRPTWPSGQPAVLAPSEVTATLSSSDDLRTGDEANPGFAAGKRPAMPELRMADESQPGARPRQRSAMPIALGGLAIAALGAILGYAVLRDAGSIPASVDPVVTPAPTGVPTAAAPPAAPTVPAAALAPEVTPPSPAPPAAPAAPPAITPPTTRPLDGRDGPDRHVHRGASPTSRNTPKNRPMTRPMTRQGDLDVPDKAIEVIRDIRQVDPPKPGAHTSKGSPIETDVALEPKRPSAPSDRPKDPTPP